jgi:hypothetical protein
MLCNQQIIPAKDPKRCGGSKRILYFNADDDVTVVLMIMLMRMVMLLMMMEDG